MCGFLREECSVGKQKSDFEQSVVFETLKNLGKLSVLKRYCKRYVLVDAQAVLWISFHI